MTDVRIDEFPIPGLEYIFVPPGLPLVTKSAQSNGTTSILIRGGAGTGKTTLAVALAHAISRKQAGVALYLTTEFVATEIAYKAARLRLPEGSAASWDTSLDLDPGTILARHLLQTHAGANEQALKTVGNRKRAAIAAVWESLIVSGNEPSAVRPIGPPVRAVVIDAFGLPEVDGEDNELRNELLTLIQSLELIGITTILVEEASIRAEAWLPFVVDVVFEIELSPDADTGDLLRRLKCPKSRYGQALAGPHDYGLDDVKCPAVWPDLAFSDACEPLQRETNLAPAVFLPEGDEFGLFPAGTVLISSYDQEEAAIHDAFEGTPGMNIAKIDCGPLTKIEMPEGEGIQVGEGQGIFALAWILIQAYHAGKINAVVIEEFGFYLARPRLRARSLRAIDMLSTTGLSVCLHGGSQELAPAEVLTDYVQGGKYSGSLRKKLPIPSLCRGDRWLPVFAAPETEATTNAQDFALRRAMLEGQPASSIGGLQHLSIDWLYFEKGFERSLTTHLMGHFGAARQSAQQNLASKPIWLARFWMAIGDGMTAAAQILAELGHAEFDRMWANLSAIYAGNPTAIESLSSREQSLTPSDAVVLMRALANNGQNDRLASLIKSCGPRFNLPPWYQARLLAELLADVPDGSDWDESLAVLTAYSELDAVPIIHRAEIWYNMGALEERRGNLDAARAARHRAAELNPQLDLQSEP